jgi:hypothetical protein
MSSFNMLRESPEKPVDLSDPTLKWVYGPLSSRTVITREEKIMKAYDKQVGGSHYKKMKIQPMQYSMANELDACQHTAIKYITRHEDKAGKKDLYKSLHTVLLLIEEKYEWTNSDSAILEAVMGAMSDE